MSDADVTGQVFGGKRQGGGVGVKEIVWAGRAGEAKEDRPRLAIRQTLFRRLCTTKYR